MFRTNLIVPPHTLHLTSLEEDNDILDMSAENQSAEEVTVTYSIETEDDDILARCRNEENSELENNPSYTTTLDSKRMSRVEFSFVYEGEEAGETTLFAEVTDGQKTVRREIPVFLAKN